jgi:phosphoglycerol transferase MdoB-like AlkP superfamily enzyme
MEREQKESFINHNLVNIDTIRDDKDCDCMNMKLNNEDRKQIDDKDNLGNNKLIDEEMKLSSKFTSEENGAFPSNRKNITSLNQLTSGIKQSLKQCKNALPEMAKSIEGTMNSYIDISGSDFLIPLMFFIGSIIYMEIMLHILLYRSIDIKIIYPILFAIPLGTLLAFITGLFQPIVNKIILWVFTIFLCFMFMLQLVYYNVFKVFFSFQSIGMADDAFSEFGADIITMIKDNIGGLLLLILPVLVLALILHTSMSYEKRSWKLQSIMVGATVIFHVVAIVTLLLFGKADYTPYDLYYNSRVLDLCGKQLGISTMTRIDIISLIFDKEELVLSEAMSDRPEKTTEANSTSIPKQELSKEVTSSSVGTKAAQTPTPKPTTVPVNTSPNSLNIDFGALAKTEKSKTIRTLHEYFASVKPTNKNKYTGMFKGYNLIMITAEGFSPYAVHKEKTPTLYKLIREGFVFNNFYTALWQTSTSDGEYVAMTGLIPVGTRNMYHGRNNLWPFSLGHQFNQLGVKSKAFHNHTYTYYQRDETHPNLGYNFKGKGNGLVLEHPDIWPESDIELMQASVDDYMDEDQFHVYYLTVSGHMNYTFQGNSIAYKNRNLVKDLPYSSDAKAYIACQMELDKALELLINKLEEAGVADKTVIALSADHYPYGWEKYKLDELAGHTVDPVFEIYRNHFILWNPGMKDKVIIDKPCSSLDIIPTLSNLFGLEYDSRLLMGQDILSDAEPLVILSNRSFITDKVMYNSETGKVTKLTKEALPEDYISSLNKVVKNKFSVSESILKNDYYRYLFPKGLN